MIVKENVKKEVISYIDTLDSNYPKYSDRYSKELKRYRDKYVYKDIGINEFIDDVNKINTIKNEVVFLKSFWS